MESAKGSVAAVWDAATWKPRPGLLQPPKESQWKTQTTRGSSGSTSGSQRGGIETGDVGEMAGVCAVPLGHVSQNCTWPMAETITDVQTCFCMCVCVKVKPGAPKAFKMSSGVLFVTICK